MKLDFESGLILEDAIDGRAKNRIDPISKTDYDSQTETLLFSVECEVILYITTMKGRLDVTTSHLRFFPDVLPSHKDTEHPKTTHTDFLQELRIFAEHRRQLSSLRRLHFRRYKLRDSGLEAFFKDGQTFMFNFFGTQKQAEKHRKSLLNVILSLNLPHFIPALIKNPETAFSHTDFTNRWVQRKISNFEYLMALNTFSGRTYNDISQYPVFPWIISDYESENLDLSNASIYRDLSKPMGAINPERLQNFQERFNTFEDPDGKIGKFLYGSHYSSSAAVMFYLLRLEPFTTFHISLQGGKFDHADRQFLSFSNLWKSVTTSTSDVKELIPEFFYFPEFLRNTNKFDLGKTQAGEVVDDVKLPPWAKTAEDFIRINRDALESDYVSNNLHHWIDLIWGYKQTGEPAIQAQNVFYYLTYEGAVDIDAVLDPMDRQSIEDQVHHFGQTPAQLFKIPHPKRLELPSTLNENPKFIVQSFDLNLSHEPQSIFVIADNCFVTSFDINLMKISMERDPSDQNFKVACKEECSAR